MKNPTPATTAADTPRSSERLKHSADVGGGEMKRRVVEYGGRVSDSQKTVPHRVRPASLHKTTLEFLAASARWSQDEFIGAMHNAKGRDYHIAAAPGPW